MIQKENLMMSSRRSISKGDLGNRSKEGEEAGAEASARKIRT